MKVHFIAIGGAAMHNLAIALVQKGFIVTGSDDEIYEPSLSRLKKHSILPNDWGWFPDKINHSIDAVVLGMHARIDNPELLKAQEIGLKIYSYPEFLYEQTKNKKRVVIGGSHGKTSVTSMIMYVLKHNNFQFDFMVGALIDGFDCMVNIEDKNEIAIFEGDEYLASPIDRRSKFHLYKPHLAVLTGIAWDHMNVFPTFENYCNQFSKFLETCEPNAKIYYANNDNELLKVCNRKNANVTCVAYDYHPNEIKNNKTFLTGNNFNTEVLFFGMHNMYNVQAAYSLCAELGVTNDQFYSAIKSFKGASKRLETLHHDENKIILRDFAHSPSKLKATINAARKQFSNFKLIAVYELHTFSSLNPEFLKEYVNTMNEADIAMVYFNPQTLIHKKLNPIDVNDLAAIFNRKDLLVFTNEKDLIIQVSAEIKEKSCILFMSSGTFNGVNLNELAIELAAL